MNGKPWTRAELKALAATYPDTPTRAVADLLGRPLSGVYRQASLLGLQKSNAYRASPAACRLRRGGEVGKEFRFKKGHVPANKGLRRPGWAPGRMAETQFKKGEMSGAAQHNYVPIGSTRISKDGYLEIKTTDDPDLYPARRWVAAHRLVWEAENGPIPPRHIIVFRPGMRTAIRAEITVDRLQCISLAENMARNSIHNYPKDIQDAVRSVAVLNRRINRVEKHQ